METLQGTTLQEFNLHEQCGCLGRKVKMVSSGSRHVLYVTSNLVNSRCLIGSLRTTATSTETSVS